MHISIQGSWEWQEECHLTSDSRKMQFYTLAEQVQTEGLILWKVKLSTNHLAPAQYFSYLANIILSLLNPFKLTPQQYLSSLLECPSEAALENYWFFMEAFVQQLKINYLCIFNSRKYTGCRYALCYNSHPKLGPTAILVNYSESQTPWEKTPWNCIFVSGTGTLLAPGQKQTLIQFYWE